MIALPYALRLQSFNPRLALFCVRVLQSTYFFRGQAGGTPQLGIRSRNESRWCSGAKSTSQFAGFYWILEYVM